MDNWLDWLNKLEEIASRATPGPWRYDSQTYQVYNSDNKFIPYTVHDQVFKAAFDPLVVKELLSELRRLYDETQQLIKEKEAIGARLEALLSSTHRYTSIPTPLRSLDDEWDQLFGDDE